MEPKEYIPSTEASELKGLTFNEECTAYYYPSTTTIGWDLIEDGMLHTNSVLVVGFTAPSYQESFRWFHTNYGWNFHVYSLWEGGYNYYINQLDGPEINDGVTKYDTYDIARLACLNKLIQTIKTI
jgi:hypothetical protein